MERARVSQILDHFCEPYLLKWKLANKDWQKVSQDALQLGTIVDQAVQDDINGKDWEFIPTGEQLINCLKAWTKFKEERPDIVVRLRQFKHNMQRELVLGDLVGHPDFILDDEVIDLKTSKQVSKSHWMQTAQYAHMWDEMNLTAPKLFEAMGMTTPPLPSLSHGGFGGLAPHPLTKITKISILRLDKLTGEYEYRTLEEPFVTFWHKKFEARYQCFMEESEFNEMMRVKLEEERL